MSSKSLFKHPSKLATQLLLRGLLTGRILIARHGVGYILQFAPPQARGVIQPVEDVIVFKPRMDMWHEPSQTKLLFELPGVHASDLQINVQDGTLSVQGERRRLSPFHEKEVSPLQFDPSSWTTNELRYGKFCRTVQVPYFIQSHHITATIKDGLLCISYPRDIQVDVQESS